MQILTVRARGLLGAAIAPLAASILFPTAALADCLPNIDGSIVSCNANDPDGFLAGDGVTINVLPAATVDGNLTVGAPGRVNNEGIIGNTGDSLVTLGGGGTFANTRIATINGAVSFGNVAGTTNSLANNGVFNADVNSTGALNVVNTFSGLEVGVITGNISSSGATNISNVGAASSITGAITLGDAADVISNEGTITGPINFGGGAASLTNAAGATITGNVTATGDTSFTNAGAFVGDLTLGAGNDTITNTGTFTGNIDMGAGTNSIGFGSTAALPTGTLTADAAGTNTINLFGSGVDTLNIAVTNFDVLNKDGTGTWSLTQPVSLSDRININAGVLATDDADWLAGNTIVNNATLQFNNLADGTYAGNLEGAGAVNVGVGGAVTTFSGVNTYTGATTVNGGTLRLQGGSALADTSTITVTAPAILDIASAETIGTLLGDGSVTLSGGTVTVGAGSFTGVISGANGLTKNTAGTLTLGGANTYTGDTTVGEGTLVVTGGAAIADAGNVIVNGGTFQVDTAEVIGSLAGGGSAVLNAGLTTGGAGTDTSFSGPISGAGSLTKEGAGTFTLSGANSYTGGTTVNAGTLAGAAGAIQGDVLVNAAGTLRFDQAANGTYAGALTGAGIVEKAGAGVLTLTGTNTGHTGAFNINAGTVSIGSETNFTAGAVTLSDATLQTTGATTLANAITLDGVGTIDTLADTTVNGVLSGTGGLTKTGAANLTLAGANSYTGGTTVSAGTLTGTTTSLQGAIVNNAAVVFDDAAGGTYAGDLSGTGSVTVDGGGTFTFTGTNTYSGATNVNAGTLVTGPTGIGDASATTVATGATLLLAADETIGSLAGAGAVDTAGFTLTAGGTSTFDGTMTGTGFTRAGAGSTTLTGTGTLTGALGVTGGSLILAPTATYTAATADVTSGSIIVGGTLNAATSAGTGTVDVLAGGALNGALSSLAGGTLRVNGTVTGDVTNAGVLSGTGTVVGNVVNSGTLSPGNSPGIFTITGDFTQTADGILAMEVTPSAVAGTGYDQLRVSGVATLDGTLSVTQSGSPFINGTNYDLVVADGGIDGDFADLSGATISPFISFTPSVVATTGTQEVYRWTVVRTDYADGLGPNATANQIAVADGFQGGVAGATGDLATVVATVDNMTAEQAQSFFDQTSAEGYGAYAIAMQDQGDLFYRQIESRLTLADLEKPAKGIWITGYGQWGDGSNDGDLFGSDQDITGVAGGFDFGGEGYLIGGAIGYSSADIDYRLGNQSGESDSWHAALYGAIGMDGFTASVKLGYIDGDFNSDRTIVVSTINRATSADFSGDQWKIEGKLGYDFASDYGLFRPFVGIDFSSGDISSFTESGAASLDLAVDSIDADFTSAVIGVDWAGDFNGLSPYVRALYRFEIDAPNGDITATFTGSAATTYTVLGIERGDAFEVDAGLAYGIGENGTIFLGYEGTFRGDLDRHGVNGGFIWTF